MPARISPTCRTPAPQMPKAKQPIGGRSSPNPGNTIRADKHLRPTFRFRFTNPPFRVFPISWRNSDIETQTAPSMNPEPARWITELSIRAVSARQFGSLAIQGAVLGTYGMQCSLPLGLPIVTGMAVATHFGPLFLTGIRSRPSTLIESLRQRVWADTTNYTGTHGGHASKTCGDMEHRCMR
jgi:hypothetical protein